MNEFDLHMGEVIAVDEANRTITVQSRVDGLPIPGIPIDTALCDQYIPVVGQVVMLLKLFQEGIRIVGVYGSETLSDQKARPIKSGAKLIQGSGGGSLYVDHAGNAAIADAKSSNRIELLANTRINMLGDALMVTIKGIGTISIMPDDPLDPTGSNAITITKTDKLGLPTSEITLTDSDITVDGTTVKLGNLPTAGCVMSLSNLPGDYSVDSLGRPVPCSTAVKGTIYGPIVPTEIA